MGARNDEQTEIDKASVVAQLESRSVEEVSQETGIAKSTLYAWRKEAGVAAAGTKKKGAGAAKKSAAKKKPGRPRAAAEPVAEAAEAAPRARKKKKAAKKKKQQLTGKNPAYLANGSHASPLFGSADALNIDIEQRVRIRELENENARLRATIATLTDNPGAVVAETGAKRTTRARA